MLQSRGLTINLEVLASAAAAALAALLLCAPPSTAGVYHVFSCRIPYGPLEGEAAPVAGGEDGIGWTHLVVGNSQYGNSCNNNGALVASLQAGTTHTDADSATWEFGAASSERIVQATLWLAGDAAGGNGYLFWVASPANPAAKDALAGEDFVSGCVYTLGCRGVGNTNEPLALANKIQVPEANLGGSHLYINASCSSASCPSDAGDEQGHAVVVYVYATDIALEEQSVPTVGNLSGELATEEDLSGTASLFFNASDPGSGVYKEIVSVDGEVLDSQIVDETTLCKEVPVPAEDGPAFLSAQPCPSSANGQVSLETTKLANGAHHLTVEVTDAAGNATTVLSKTIEVSNETASSPGSSQQPTNPQTPAQGAPGPTTPTGQNEVSQSNGTPASENPTLTAAWVQTAGSRVDGTRLGGAFGHAETVTGTLTGSGGGPIADARIAVEVRKSYGGAPSISLGSVLTGPDGRYTLHLAKQSPSEQLQISYSPTLGGRPAVSRTLLLRVRAAVELHVTPSSASAGGTIRLQGRVLGGPIPPGGKQVVLEARSKGSRWLQFLVLRSGRSGRFHGTHRFRLPGPVRYWFRAVCPEEADFPFATGSSGQVAVWEH